MKPEIFSKLIHAVANLYRLECLSNRDLVMEAAHCDVADADVVAEMMRRLYPAWLTERCECAECHATPGATSPAGDTGPESHQRPPESVG